MASVPCYVRPGGLLFVLLVAWLLASLFFPLRFPTLPAAARWFAALLTAFLFAATVLAHEAAHVWVARRRGLRTTGITFFYFGAVAWFEDEPTRPQDEGAVALAGPAANGAIALLVAALWALLRHASPLPLAIAAESLSLLALINVSLLVFNALPAYPLDGGRILHALLWGAQGDGAAATRQTARVGQGLALGVALATLWVGARGAYLSAFASLSLALFLFRGGSAALRDLPMRRRMNELRVGELMWRDSPTVGPAQSLHEASVVMARHVQSELPVVEGGHFVGLLLHADLRHIAHQERALVRVAEVMRHAALVPQLAPEERADAALRRMARANLLSLPVLEGEEWVGLLRQRDLVGRLRA